MTHDYKRNGTTTLFAALDMLEGRLIGRCMPRHRHQEFIKFLQQIDAETPPELVQPGGSFSATIDTNALGASITPYTITYSYTGDANFRSASDASTMLTVNQATPTLNWPNPAAIVYGTPLSSAQLDATASVAGSFTYTPAAGTVLKAGAGQTLSVSFIPTDTSDYTGASTTATIDVAQATPTITWSGPAEIIYGSTLSSTQLDATASVPGTFTYTPSAGTVLKAGTGQTLSVSFTPTDATDYKSTSTTATINVGKATSTITWPNPVGITYGTPLSSTQLDATSSIPGSFDYLPAAGAILNAGAGQVLAVTFTPNDAADYTTAGQTATIDVAKATPTISLVAPGGTFDGSPFAASVTIAGSGNQATPAASLEDVAPVLAYYVGSGTSGTSLGSTPPIHPGTYTAVANFPGSADYTATQSLPVTFTIDKSAPGIALVPSIHSSVFGQAVTLVAGVSFGEATPGGSVTFYDGSAPLGTVPVDAAGKATLTTTSLAVGSHSITAAYGGDGDLLPGASGASEESVARAATHVVLVPQPVFKKKHRLVSLGLKAEVLPIAPGAGVPTGMVTFEIQKKVRKRVAEKVLGTLALSGGSATLSVKPSGVLKKPITILYGGDPDFTASMVSPSPLTQKALRSMA
jgi:hypothetical protein